MKIKDQQYMVLDHYFQQLRKDVADRMGWDHDIDAGPFVTWCTVNFEWRPGSDPLPQPLTSDIVFSDPRMIGLYGLPYTILLTMDEAPHDYVLESKWLQPLIRQIILTNKIWKRVTMLRMKINRTADKHNLCVSTKREFDCLPPSHKHRQVFIDVGGDGAVLDAQQTEVAPAYVVYGSKKEWNLEAATEVARMYGKFCQLTDG